MDRTLSELTTVEPLEDGPFTADLWEDDAATPATAEPREDDAATPEDDAALLRGFATAEPCEFATADPSDRLRAAGSRAALISRDKSCAFFLAPFLGLREGVLDSSDLSPGSGFPA